MGSVSLLVFKRTGSILSHRGILAVLVILFISQTVFSVPSHSGSEREILVLITRLDEALPEQPSLTSAVSQWLVRAYADFVNVEVMLLDAAVPPGEWPQTGILQSMPMGSFVVVFGHCTVENERILCTLNYDIITNGNSEENTDPATHTGIEFSLQLSELARAETPDIVSFFGYSALASVYYHQGDISAAGQTCTIALGGIEGVPDEYISEITSLRTEILTEIGDLNALADLDEAIEQEPGNGEFYLTRALINARLGNYAAMLLDTDAAIELESGSTESGILYVAGILELQTIIRRDYNNGADITPEIFDRMEESLDEALLIASRAIELDSASADLFYNRAGVYGYRTDWPSAVEDLTAALRLNPDFPEAYNKRGNINVEMGFLEQGISDLSKAIELSPDSVSYYEDRAFAYQYAGDPENAQADLQTAEELRLLQRENLMLQ